MKLSLAAISLPRTLPHKTPTLIRSITHPVRVFALVLASPLTFAVPFSNTSSTRMQWVSGAEALALVLISLFQVLYLRSLFSSKPSRF